MSDVSQTVNLATPNAIADQTNQAAAAQAGTSAAPQTPQAPAAGAQAPAQAAQAPAAAPQAAPQQPQPPQKSAMSVAFENLHDILNRPHAGSQAPTRDANGNILTDPSTGKIVTHPMSVKSIGAGILAGALASMVAGYAAGSPQQNPYTGRFTQGNLGAAAQAGAEAGQQFSPSGMRAQAQKMSDDDRTRAYNTYSQNISNHALGLQFNQLDTTSKKEFVNNAEATMQAIKALDADKGGIIAGEDETEQQLMDRIKNSGGDVTRDSALPTGLRPEIDPETGKPTGRQEVLWTSFKNHGSITITPEFAKQFPQYQQAVGQQLPIVAAAKLFQNASYGTALNGAMNSLVNKQSEFNKDNGGKPVNFDFQKFMTENRINLTPQQKQAAASAMAGNDPDKAIPELVKVDSRFAMLYDKLGVDKDKWENHRKSSAASSTDQAKRMDKIRNPENAADAQSSLAYAAAHPGELDPQIVAQAQTMVNNEAVLAGNKAAAEAKARMPFELQKQRAEQAIKSGDPSVAGRQLAEGDLALSELKTRGATPEFIEKAVDAANAYAKANGIKNFNVQQRDAEYTIAKNQQNTNFFNAINSLTDQDTGTLNQLKQQAAKLGNSRFPALNSIDLYRKYQTGDPALAGFMQTAIGVADDYAKVVAGGGQGSDNSRMQVLHSFSKAYGPEAMNAAIDAARGVINSQKASRLRGNFMLQKMYGGDTSGSLSGNAGGNASGSASANTVSPASHKFSLSAWQQANPNGDVNAAKAAALKAGYQVVQ